MPGATARRLVTGVDHYENFPVASLLVPRRLRPALRALYRFARYADDVADEGDAPPAARIAELRRLRDALSGEPGPHDPAVVAQLRPYLQAHGLAPADCLALLCAFEQDVTVHRYADFPALFDYCRRSANPVGRLVLQLFGQRSAARDARSDAICTALQLINFLQDTAIDWRKGRLYLPLDELRAAGLDEADVASAVAGGRAPPPLRALIAVQARRAGALLESGAPLADAVPLRLALELRGVLAGGRRILEQLSAAGHDPIATRPSLGWRDAPALVRLMLRAPAPT